MASGVDTHTHTHTHTHTLWRNESDFKKPSARRPAAGAPGLKIKLQLMEKRTVLGSHLQMSLNLANFAFTKEVAIAIVYHCQIGFLCFHCNTNETNARHSLSTGILQYSHALYFVLEFVLIISLDEYRDLKNRQDYIQLQICIETMSSYYSCIVLHVPLRGHRKRFQLSCMPCSTSF